MPEAMRGGTAGQPEQRRGLSNGQVQAGAHFLASRAIYPVILFAQILTS